MALRLRQCVAGTRRFESTLNRLLQGCKSQVSNLQTAWLFFVLEHKFQNLLYTFQASAWHQYLSHDHRAPSAPAVLKTNLTDVTMLH